jgi:hypothetical protein
MPSTLATVSHITKEVYGPKVVNTLNEEDVLAKRMEKTADGVVTEHNGKYVTFPLRVRRNHGIGYRRENEKLQKAGQQGYISVRVPIQYGYGRVHVTGQVMDLVDTNAKAFHNAMTKEMDGLKVDLRKDVNRIMYGDGTGTLATIATNTIDTTLTVANAQYLEEGMQIDIINPATDAVAFYDIQIVSVDGTSVEVSQALGAFAANALEDYIIVRNGNYNREPQGLTSLVDDTGELFGVDAALERKWRAHVNSNSGTPRPLSEGLMIALCDTIRTAGTGKPSAIFSDLASRRAYFNLLSQQRTYPSPKTYDGGLVGLAFHYGREIPVVEDVDAPAGKMWFLDESSFKIYRDKEWAWEDRDGSIWKWVTDYDAYEAILKQYWEFALDIRNANGVLEDILPG